MPFVTIVAVFGAVTMMNKSEAAGSSSFSGPPELDRPLDEGGEGEKAVS